jgi:hypothetical protein
MIILESIDINEDSIRKVVSELKQISFDKPFDKTIDGINFYYTKDQDKVVFLTYKDGYGSVTKAELDNESEDDIVQYISDQFDKTVDE